jgi:Tsi6
MNSPAETVLAHAKNRCAELMATAPQDQSLTMAMAQLDFICATLEGRANDPGALQRINLGLLAAREFEVRAPDFADMLYAVEDVVARLRR